MWSKLSFTIEDYIKQRGLEASFKENEACMVWKEVVEEVYPGSARYCIAKGVQGNILKVYISHPLWISELEAGKKTLMEKIIAKTQFPIQNILFIYNSKVF